AIAGLCPEEAAGFLEVLAFYGLCDMDFALNYEPGGDHSSLARCVSDCWDREDSFSDASKSDLPQTMGVREDSVPSLPSQELVAEEYRKGAKEIITAWQTLQKAFEKATKVEDSYLSLRIGEDFGDPDEYSTRAFYHEFSNEVYYTVDNAYQLS